MKADTRSERGAYILLGSRGVYQHRQQWAAYPIHGEHWHKWTDYRRQNLGVEMGPDLHKLHKACFVQGCAEFLGPLQRVR
jgi:hypothetical protein